MKKILTSFTTMALATGVLILSSHTSTAATATTTVKPKLVEFIAEVWADNWFALYANGKLVGEDSVPITTERSFNAETIKFTATYPLTIGLVAKDFTQDASGLEYIGSPRQQIGDGGIIAQIKEVKSGKVVTATSSAWKSFTANTAPLNPTCVTSSKPAVECQSSTVSFPSGWNSASFNDASWKSATQYSPQDVGVKDGYLNITWSPTAKLVWSSDLKLDNTVLLRAKVLK